jgi:hypothetical protein
LDVGSAERDAFTQVDQRALEGCAATLTGLLVEGSAGMVRGHRSSAARVV